MEKEIKCRCISRGRGAGRALICREPVGFNFGVDVRTGRITEHKHVLEGISFAGRVLVFPRGKGSTGGSYILYQTVKEGTAPAAIINLETETIIASGAIMGGIPVVDHLEEDPFEEIGDGDFVEVDAAAGIVRVEKEGKA